MNQMYDDEGHRINFNKLLQSQIKKSIQTKGLENELGGLLQGFLNRVKAQDAIEFIQKKENHVVRKVLYNNFVCDYQTLKAEHCRVRMAVGSDKVDYPYSTVSQAAPIIETK